MTPVVFLISGLIFAATAATYAEATTMYPEAGGSSSFARHAFNEFWSFFAAWGQMLNYIITFAISAFFVPHYLGVFWEPLRHVARRHHRRHRGGRAARRAEHRRRQGGGRAQHLPGARRLLHAAAARDRRLRPRVLARRRWSTTSTSARTRRWSDFLIAIPVGMVAYTGIETISNMAEEAQGLRARRSRARSAAWSIAVRRSTRSCPRSRCRRCRW